MHIFGQTFAVVDAFFAWLYSLILNQTTIHVAWIIVEILPDVYITLDV